MFKSRFGLSALVSMALGLCSTSVVPAGSVGILRDSAPGEDGGGEAETSKNRKIAMDDGREVVFGEKQKIQKEHGVEDGNVFARIDFDNGKVVKVIAFVGNLAEIAAQDSDEGKAAGVTLKAVGHGLVQKLGDAAAGAESTDDAFEAILEVATRFQKGDWTKAREGGGSAKGASELVTALTEYMQSQAADEEAKAKITKDTVRDLLGNVSPAEKNALRKVPEVAAIIERLKAERAPTKAEQEKVAKAGELLKSLATGKVPPKAEEPAAA